jgi:hypothetical protein
MLINIPKEIDFNPRNFAEETIANQLNRLATEEAEMLDKFKNHIKKNADIDYYPGLHSLGTNRTQQRILKEIIIRIVSERTRESGISPIGDA